MVPPQKSSQNLEAKTGIKHCRYRDCCLKLFFLGATICNNMYIYIYRHIAVELQDPFVTLHAHGTCFEPFKCLKYDVVLYDLQIGLVTGVTVLQAL